MAENGVRVKNIEKCGEPKPSSLEGMWHIKAKIFNCILCDWNKSDPLFYLMSCVAGYAIMQTSLNC